MAIGTKRGDILPYKEVLSVIEQLLDFHRQISDERIAAHNDQIERADIEKFNATGNLVDPILQKDIAATMSIAGKDL